MTDARVLEVMLALALAGVLLVVLATFLIVALLAYVFNPLMTHVQRRDPRWCTETNAQVPSPPGLRPI